MMDKMNLLMAADDNFFKPFLSTLSSIAHNTNVPIRLFFAGKLSQEQIEMIKSIKADIEVNCVIIEKEYLDIIKKGKQTKYYPINALFRLICPFLIKGIDRLMWIDSDIIVTKNIYNLYNSPLNNKSLFALEDKTTRAKKIKNICGYNIKTYFISCLLIFDIDVLKKKHSIEELSNIIDVIKDDTAFPDQDILNVMYANDVIISKDDKIQRFVWNQIRDDKIKGDQYLFYHYAGDVKPWDNNYYNWKNAFIFWRYAKQYYSHSERITLLIKQRLSFVKKSFIKLFRAM